jgi:hypothetical protein
MSDTGGAVQTRIYYSSKILLVMFCNREKRVIENYTCGFPQYGIPNSFNRYDRNDLEINETIGHKSLNELDLSSHDLHAGSL